MVAKCGTVVRHHWAHPPSASCYDWEPETDWHLEWKSRFPPEWVEVFRDGCRADVLIPHRSGGETAIEFQRKGLDAETIWRREQTWGDVIWIAYAHELAWKTLTVYGEETDIPQLDLRKKFDPQGRYKYTSFRWRYARRSWEAAERPPILDLEDELFEIHKVHWDGKVGGWGHLLGSGEFVRRELAKAQMPVRVQTGPYQPKCCCQSGGTGPAPDGRCSICWGTLPEAVLL
jgi:hypothetical protein